MIRWTRILPMLMLAILGPIVLTAPGQTATMVGLRQPPLPPPFCITCHIVDLSSVVGGGAIDLIPTAINNADQIVGYDGGSGANAGKAYLINPDLSFASFTQGNFFLVPTAISNFGKSIVGEANDFDQFGYFNKDIIVWKIVSPRIVALNYLGGPTDGDLAFQIASGNVPVAGAYFYGLTSLAAFSATVFPSSGCAITDFLARAINDGGTIVGSGGGYAAYGSTTGCASPIALPRPANGFTQAHGINSGGDLLVSFTGLGAPAFGSEYLVKGGRFLRIALPSTYASRSDYLVARAISDGDEIVGDILSETPPFAPAAPFVYQDGTSVDLNSILPRNSGWKLLTAAGVSAGGEVIGTGYHNGVLRGYALAP